MSWKDEEWWNELCEKTLFPVWVILAISITGFALGVKG